MKHQYLKQKLIEVKRGIVKYIIMREFNTPLPIIDSSGSTRIWKNIGYINSLINKIDPVDIDKILS